MDPVVQAALKSWSVQPGVLILILPAALAYLRGWRRLHRQVPGRFPRWRPVCYLSGLAALWLAVASPLDAFAGRLLQVHMVQHLLLTMVVPPLIWLGAPWLPLLRGLPKSFVRDALGPFLASPVLKCWTLRLTHPALCWTIFIATNLLWHWPPLYELALRSKAWHAVEHAAFLGAALLFWWPVIQPWPGRAQWPRWSLIPYLLLADLQNTALAAFFSFCDRVLYPAYETASRLRDLNALEDQAAAGAIMWVVGSVAFLIPAAWITVTLLMPSRGVRPSEWPRAAHARPSDPLKP